MKLIDLLVKELPKRGGFPEGANECVQDSDGTVKFYDFGSLSFSGYGWIGYPRGKFCCKKEDKIIGLNLSCDHSSSIITRAQYESALAASQKTAWNGEGLPPVGCECECHVDEGIIHCVVVGYDFDGKAVVMRNVPARKYFSIQANSGRIKPLRTEAERKRDAAIEAMQREADEGDNWIYSEYEIIYDAIAAGKIPGVKLDD